MSRRSCCAYASSTPGAEAGRRQPGEHLPGQHAVPHPVHAALGVADRHRHERVPVVPAAPGQQPGLGREAAGAPVLQAHLHRDLDADRARVAQEDVLEPVRGELDQPAGEGHGRLVRQPAEHHVAHPGELVAGRGVQRRVGVPVDRRPPGRHAVDQLTAAGQAQPHPLGRLDDERLLGAGHRPVRMPHPPPVDLEQVLRHPRRVLDLEPGLGPPPAPLPRFSRIRMLTLMGLPAKPKSSRRRRSMNRR